MSTQQVFAESIFHRITQQNRVGASYARRFIQVLFVVSLAILVPTSVQAKPKKKTFNNSASEVFQAALRTARERYVVSYVDEKNLMLTFETGVSAFSYGFNANASVEPEAENRASLLINVQKKNVGKTFTIAAGAGGRMADDFFKQVEEELARHSKQTVALRPEAPHVDVPPSALESNNKPTETSSVRQPEETRSTIGSLIVSSVPEAAELFIDGLPVGNAPARVQLPTGKHSIRASIKGYKEITREIGMFPSSELKLSLVLEPDSDASSTNGSGTKQVAESKPTSSDATVSRSSDATTLPNIAAEPVHAGIDIGIGNGGFLGAASEENPRVRHDGVTLSVVDPGGPADQAGIRAGDVILAVDDHYLYTAEELLAEVRNHQPGSRVHVRYRRHSAINEAYVILEREHF